MADMNLMFHVVHILRTVICYDNSHRSYKSVTFFCVLVPKWFVDEQKFMHDDARRCVITISS